MKSTSPVPIIVGLAAILAEVITALIVLQALGRLAGGSASRRPARSGDVARARMRADPALSGRDRK